MRRKTGKKPGGQLGHPGETPHLVAEPDTVVEHRPTTCATCQSPLEAGAGAEGVARERHQVQDLPPVRLRVTEHQALSVRCPARQQVTVGVFPAEAPSRAQYGPRLRALAVYLVAQQFVPYARTRDLLADLCGTRLSGGTLVEWVQQSAEALEPVETALKAALQHAPVLHSDETGVRRIEALTGVTADSFLRGRSDLLSQVSARMRTQPDEVMSRVEAFQDELAAARRGQAHAEAERLAAAAARVRDVVVVAGVTSVTDDEALRALSDTIRARTGPAVVARAWAGRAADALTWRRGAARASPPRPRPCARWLRRSPASSADVRRTYHSGPPPGSPPASSWGCLARLRALVAPLRAACGPARNGTLCRRPRRRLR